MESCCARTRTSAPTRPGLARLTQPVLYACPLPGYRCCLMRPPPGEPADAGRDATLPPPLLAALTLLRQAQRAALELHHDPWEFAVGLPELVAVGLTGTEVRWLLASGLAEHALERVRPSQD